MSDNTAIYIMLGIDVASFLFVIGLVLWVLLFDTIE